MNDQERLTELESRVAFQEDTLDTLNEIVSRQELEIEQFKRMIKVMNQRMKSLTNDSPTGSPDDEPPPPHY